MKISSGFPPDCITIMGSDAVHLLEILEGFDECPDCGQEAPDSELVEALHMAVYGSPGRPWVDKPYVETRTPAQIEMDRVISAWASAFALERTPLLTWMKEDK